MAGGYGETNGYWDWDVEQTAKRDYEAAGAGMSFEDFLRSRGTTDRSLACREQWVAAGSRPEDFAFCWNARGGIVINKYS